MLSLANLAIRLGIPQKFAGWAVWGAAALAVILALGWAYSAIYSAGEANIQRKWDEDVKARTAAYVALQDQYRKREQALNQKVGVIAQEKANAEARTADAQHRLADSLRKRPERPAGLPDAGAVTADGKDPPKCTGAQLYRDDLEFLRREAEAADGLRHALKACYDQYDAAVGI